MKEMGHNCEQADSRHSRGGRSCYHHFLKVRKRRLERRKARRDPQAPATYGKYQGYET